MSDDVIQYRHGVLALMREHDLRDRWGHPLGPNALAGIVKFVVQDPDHDADALITQMLIGELTVVCEGYDTPADDLYVQEIIDTIRTIYKETPA